MSVLVQNNSIHFLSSKEASARSGYTSDYISRLAREGKIAAKRVGIQWFVDATSLEVFLMESERAREARKEALRLERMREREQLGQRVVESVAAPASPVHQGAQETTVRTLITTEDNAEPLFAPFGTAHKHAFAAVSVGVLLACVGALAPSVSRGAQSAFLTQSFFEAMQSVTFFAFPWTFEVALAPEVPIRHSVPENNIPTPTHQGIVVLPGTASEQTLKEVRDSFSDDVLVSVHSHNTGTIVPVFQDGAGDEYRFVIVPVGQSP